VKISDFSGVNNGTDDSVLVLSYTTDNGTTYTTKKIRLADLIDDFNFDDLADTDIGTPSTGDMLKWDGTNWVSFTGSTGSFTSNDSKTVTVTNGIITDIT